MVRREELSMFVERRILATLRQKNEHQRSLAYQTWEPPMNTPAAENPICRQVMQGVLVPNMHLEVCLCSSVVCPYPFLPSIDQIINQRLHVHTHIIPRLFRNYQQQEYVLSLKEDARGEIERDNEHGPTSVWCSRHSIRIDPSIASATRTLRASRAFSQWIISNLVHALPLDGCTSFSGLYRHPYLYHVIYFMDSSVI